MDVDDFSYATAAVTESLKAIVMADRMNVSFWRIVIWGEQSQPELREWYDQIISQPSHSGNTEVKPWSNSDLVLVASTATEMCMMLIRACHQTLVPDGKLLWSVPGSQEVVLQGIADYERDNEAILTERFGHISRHLIPQQWLSAIADAEQERVAMVGPVEWSTPRPPAEWIRIFDATKGSFSDSSWRRLRKDSPNAFRGTTRDVSVKRSLLEKHGVKMPEFKATHGS